MDTKGILVEELTTEGKKLYNIIAHKSEHCLRSLAELIHTAFTMKVSLTNKPRAFPLGFITFKLCGVSNYFLMKFELINSEVIFFYPFVLVPRKHIQV